MRGSDERTGSLFSYGTPEFTLRLTKDPVPPNTWFTQEFIASGDRLTVKVNGQLVSEVTDNHYSRGHVALHNFKQQGTVLFRKIEIKELPQAHPSTFKNTLGMEFVLVPKGKSWLGGGKDKPGAVDGANVITDRGNRARAVGGAKRSEEIVWFAGM